MARGNFLHLRPGGLLACGHRGVDGDFVFGQQCAATAWNRAVDSAKFPARAQRDPLPAVARCKAECDYFRASARGGGGEQQRYWEQGSFDCSETQRPARYRHQTQRPKRW